MTICTCDTTMGVMMHSAQVGQVVRIWTHVTALVGHVVMLWYCSYELWIFMTGMRQ